MDMSDMFKVFRKEVDWAGRKLILETGKVARQADGAVMATYGGTTVLATVVYEKKPKPGLEVREPGAGAGFGHVLRGEIGLHPRLEHEPVGDALVVIATQHKARVASPVPTHQQNRPFDGNRFPFLFLRRFARFIPEAGTLR